MIKTEFEEQRERITLLERQLEILAGYVLDCPQCKGFGEYWTEWSDAAQSDLYHRSRVVYYPPQPDGTVLYRCACQLEAT